MAVAHYGYLVMKIPTPTGVLTVRGDRSAAIAAVEKLHALTMDAARSEGSDPSTSSAGMSTQAPRPPKVRLSDSGDVPVKTIQVGMEPSQTTRIAGNLEEK